MHAPILYFTWKKERIVLFYYCLIVVEFFFLEPKRKLQRTKWYNFSEQSWDRFFLLCDAFLRKGADVGPFGRRIALHADLVPSPRLVWNNAI